MHRHSSSASMAAVHSCFNSCSHKDKIIHLTIISSSQFSSYSTNLSNNVNVSLHSLKSRQSLTEKPLRNGKTRVSLMVTKPCSVKKKPLWKNLVFGSKRMRSIILLHIICIVYGIFYLISYSLRFFRFNLIPILVFQCSSLMIWFAIFTFLSLNYIYYYIKKNLSLQILHCYYIITIHSV